MAVVVPDIMSTFMAEKMGKGQCPSSPLSPLTRNGEEINKQNQPSQKPSNKIQFGIFGLK